MKKKILAIDNSKAIRFLLQTVLGKDYHVVTAPDGCSAMSWLSKRNLPDVIILDAQLPDMEDWELVEQLASSGLYGEIPIIVISSFEKSFASSKCAEYNNVDTYFVKPFNPLVVLETVKNVITAKKTPDTYAAQAG